METKTSITFRVREDAFDRTFPDAFTLANPEPKFSMGGKVWMLLSITKPPIKDRCPEDGGTILAHAVECNEVKIPMADVKRLPKNRKVTAPKMEEPTGTKIVLYLDDDTIDAIDKHRGVSDDKYKAIPTREEFVLGALTGHLTDLVIAEIEG